MLLQTTFAKKSYAFSHPHKGMHDGNAIATACTFISLSGAQAGNNKTRSSRKRVDLIFSLKVTTRDLYKNISFSSQQPQRRHVTSVVGILRWIEYYLLRVPITFSLVEQISFAHVVATSNLAGNSMYNPASPCYASSPKRDENYYVKEKDG